MMIKDLKILIFIGLALIIAIPLLIGVSETEDGPYYILGRGG